MSGHELSGHELARRHLLLGSGGVLLAACSSSDDTQRGDADRPQAAEAAGDPTSFQEAPALAERVQAGELPPVAERLPDEPLVVRPGALVPNDAVELAIGQHGGTLQLAQESPNGDPVIFMGMNEPLLWAPSGFGFDAGIEGNVVAGWEANDDDTEFVFHLRSGLHWSDGEPVTIDDVRFAFDDVLFNSDVTSAFPRYLRAGASGSAPPVTFEVIDDLTFSLSFEHSYGTFPAQLAIAEWRGYGDIIKPRHYLEQFHADYASARDLKELLRAESLGEDQWFVLLDSNQLTGWMWDATTEAGIGHPTLMPWMLTRVEGGVFRYERNPYYFKVDTQGNQLPYIDTLRSQVVQDKETLTSRALFGEFDYLGERATFRQLPLMADRADTGEIALFAPRQHVLPTTVFLNLTFDDEVWREITNDVGFRRALSLAINRSEIIDNFYLGEFAQQPEQTGQAKFDRAEAERLLDEVGLAERDDEGFRIGPDGARFTVPFEIADLTENHIPVAELIAEYWRDVGVHTTVRPVDATLRAQRAEANELKATIVWVHQPIWASAGWDDYLPKANWGPLWQEWYESQAEAGEEPPPAVRELFEHHEDLMAATTGSTESAEASERIMRSHRDHLWNIQLVENALWPTFFSARVKNVPTGIPADMLGIIATASMEQWYLDG